jgi:RND superfamily putative drug exporter
VITSAGIVLAAVFAALGVLPLVTLGQLGLIVGVGVVVDTLVVRTVIVPAIFALVGDRIWWPSSVTAR